MEHSRLSDGAPIPEGTVLDGKYLVREELGRGSMGVVYLGSDMSLERDVAIKVLLPKFAKQQRLAQRFKLEAVAMAAVHAENVVQIFSYGDFEGYPYFVMEHVPGFTVASLIERTVARDEQLYLDVVLGILRQVCRGLEAVHARGIVHRDVKPANMLVGPQFKVSITDFGLVETGRKTDERDLAGTPLYLAPELIRKNKLPEELRFRSDIYSLGISTYEMLTGDVPFDGPSIKAILRRHLDDSPAPVSDHRNDIPASVDAVVARALEKDPHDRYASCGDFIGEMEAARLEASRALPTKNTAPRILVVDDDLETRTVFKTALQVAHPEAGVSSAPDGFQGLEMAKAATPQLMLVDIHLPGMNGIELIAAIKDEAQLQDVRIVVISAEINAQQRSALSSLGVFGFIEKPVELSALLEIARRALQA